MRKVIWFEIHKNGKLLSTYNYHGQAQDLLKHYKASDPKSVYTLHKMTAGSRN